MTKTNYEKELEREIDRYRELSKMSYEVGGDNDYQYEIHYLKAKLEGYKKAKQEYEKMLKQTNLRNHKREKKLKQEERERVLKEFEKLENKGLE
ncbi:MAG TPA: hypothetical protein VKN74_07340, partial [Candidatus Mcinerneyibacterium sp.]|nr:hypothetical protein [Candidatus Mcinerneyibacterium sp.]